MQGFSPCDDNLASHPNFLCERGVFNEPVEFYYSGRESCKRFGFVGTCRGLQSL